MTEHSRHLTALTLAVITLGTLLGASSRMLRAQVTGSTGPTEGACEENQALFPRDAELQDGENTIIDHWAQIYHERVDAVVEENLNGDTAAVCDQGVKTPAGPLLTELAKDIGREVATEEEAPAVLLTYLAAYECSLEAESFVVESQAERDLAYQDSKEAATVWDFNALVDEERKAIGRELAMSRRALDRTLIHLAGRNRFAPLRNAISCLQDASVNILNNASLAVQASACLPRVRDVRTSLRTITPSTPTR